ncbi:hypothetical protein VTN77DRAFT_8470 [Rasamsonia byssochlamydoides]|uniref:uncharacterized protein n=1 Tax=Rasamsonia byssochlamydoides TaxID=89139 RepID=UPI003742567E
MSNVRQVLEATFNHVVLPPRLPGKRDQEIEKIEKDLVARLLRAVNCLIDLSSTATRDASTNAWYCLRRSLEICQTIHDGQIDKVRLVEAFSSIQSEVGIILHITEQNAGLLVQREKSDGAENVKFEALKRLQKLKMSWRLQMPCNVISLVLQSPFPFHNSCARPSRKALQHFWSRLAPSLSSSSHLMLEKPAPLW